MSLFSTKYYNEEVDLRVKVILSATRALLGSITANLRGVTVDYNEKLLTLKAYFDSGATIDEKELIDAALSEMVADLYKDVKNCRYEAVDLPYPIKMDVLKDWVFMRHENR